MAVTSNSDRRTVTAPRAGQSLAQSLAHSLGVDDNELDLLEGFFVEAAAAKGASGRKIFAKLKAGVAFGQALEVPNTAVEILYSRAHRWSAVGRHDKAEPLFRALCILNAGSADFWTGLGICLRVRSAWDEALAAFATASERSPHWAVPHFHALELCVRREAWTQATTELAAFEQKADSETHPALIAEAGRYKSALELRASGDTNGVSNP
jgi:tetratricopeptide (TPR) repeat protein